MSRLNYSDDEDWPGQFALWNANVRRQIHSKAGQAELREFEAALLAMPEKRLVKDVLVDESGAVCAIGCYAKHKGLDLSKFDPECESDEVGIQAGMPELVAWKIVALNDIEIDGTYGYAEGPARKPYYEGHGEPESRGVWTFFPFSPEERYQRVLAWVREELKPVGGH